MRHRSSRFQAEVDRRVNEARRSALVETYAEWYPREELEKMSLAEIIAHRNAGHFDRPTLPEC